MSRQYPTRPAYVDSSLLVALLAPDDLHHRSARVWAESHLEPLLTSALAEVELGRVLVRRQAPGSLQVAARRLLARCELVEVTAEIRSAAIRVRPASVRTLDALHVATALAAGVREFASFDARQRVAAEEMGLALAELR